MIKSLRLWYIIISAFLACRIFLTCVLPVQNIVFYQLPCIGLLFLVLAIKPKNMSKLIGKTYVGVFIWVLLVAGIAIYLHLVVQSHWFIMPFALMLTICAILPFSYLPLNNNPKRIDKNSVK